MILAIDEINIAEKFRNPRRVGLTRRRIKELAGFVQHPVADRQRNFILGAWKIQRVLGVAANQDTARTDPRRY